MQEATLRALEDARRLLDLAASDVDVQPLLAQVVSNLDAIVAGHRAPVAPTSDRVAQEQHLLTMLEQAAAKRVEDVLWCTIEQAPLAILALDREARVRLWNPECERLFGWTAEEALGGPPPFVPPERADEFRENFERVRAGEAMRGVEIERRARDGKRLALALWTAGLHDADGAFLGTLGMVADISPRRALEQELAARERLLDAVFELLPVGVWIADETGTIVRGNPAGVRIWGGARWVGPEAYDAYRAWRVDTGAPLAPEDWGMYRAVTLGETTPGELLRIQRFDGSFRTILNWALPLRSDGRILGGIAVNEDVTPLQETREALDPALERERRLRSLLEAVGDAAARISDAVATISGSTVGAVLEAITDAAREVASAEFVAVGLGGGGERPFDAWVQVGACSEPGAPAPSATGLIGAATLADHSMRVEDATLHPAYQPMPLGQPPIGPFMAAPLRFRGARLGTLFMGRPPGAPTFTADEERAVDLLAGRAAISVETARLYAAEAVDRAYLQAVIEQIPVGVVLLDRDGHARALNAAALELVGRPERVADPLHAFDARDERDAPIADERLPLARALERGEVVLGEELLLRTASGGAVPILANAVPVRGRDGALVGAATTLQDVSAFKELERLRIEWAAVVAHDLRAPIGTIGLAAQLLSQPTGSETPARAERALEHIRNAVVRLDCMVDDLSDVSRLEARRVDIRPRPVDLSALARDVVSRVADLTPGLRVTVRATGPVVALVDPARLEQVLTNLLTNAARYGDPGAEVVVAVLAGEAEADLVVTNEGPGIAPDELPHVFERFTRTRRSREGDTPGLGLGLYISRGLVEAQGGRIRVESTPGATTSFHVAVPLAPPHADLQAP